MRSIILLSLCIYCAVLAREDEERSEAMERNLLSSYDESPTPYDDEPVTSIHLEPSLSSNLYAAMAQSRHIQPDPASITVTPPFQSNKSPINQQPALKHTPKQIPTQPLPKVDVKADLAHIVPTPAARHVVAQHDDIHQRQKRCFTCGMDQGMGMGASSNMAVSNMGASNFGSSNMGSSNFGSSSMGNGLVGVVPDIQPDSVPVRMMSGSSMGSNLGTSENSNSGSRAAFAQILRESSQQLSSGMDLGARIGDMSFGQNNVVVQQPVQTVVRRVVVQQPVQVVRQVVQVPVQVQQVPVQVRMVAMPAANQNQVVQQQSSQQDYQQQQYQQQQVQQSQQQQTYQQQQPQQAYQQPQRDVQPQPQPVYQQPQPVQVQPSPVQQYQAAPVQQNKLYIKQGQGANDYMVFSTGTYTLQGALNTEVRNDGYTYTMSTYTRIIDAIPTIGVVTLVPMQTYYAGKIIPQGQNAFGYPNTGTYNIAGSMSQFQSNGYAFTVSSYTQLVDGRATYGAITLAPLQTYFNNRLLGPNENPYGYPNQGTYTINGQMNTVYVSGYPMTVSTYTRLVDGVATYGTITLGSMQTFYNNRLLQQGENAYGLPNSGEYTLPGPMTSFADNYGYPVTVSSYTKFINGRATFGAVTKGMQMTYYNGKALRYGENPWGFSNEGLQTINGGLSYGNVDGDAYTYSTMTRVLNGNPTYVTMTIMPMRTVFVPNDAGQTMFLQGGTNPGGNTGSCAVCV